MVFDGSAWYGNPRFSDVTIKFSGRELKAHKLVLCSRSKYFQRALGEDGAFMVRFSDLP